MVKRVLRYISGTLDYGILFNGGQDLVAYSDSDFAGDAVTGHSTSGVLLMRGGPIVWFAQKQCLIASSTAEAEYRAAVAALDEVSWIRRLVSELGRLDQGQPTPLCNDNQSAVQMLENTHKGKITKGKKHIEIPRKFIQQHIGSTVELKKVKSQDQLADILTKPLTKGTYEKLRDEIVKGGVL